MILVLTTPRTGSTSFCEQLARTHSYENLDEYFDEESTVDDQLTKLEYIKQNKNTVIKCFPWHLNHSLFLEKNVITLAEKIYILIRSNFADQCKSYYLAKSTDIWSGAPQQHQTVYVDDELFNFCVKRLISGYNQLEKYYRIVDSELVDYNELSFEIGRKYIRPVTFINEPKYVDFDVKALFT